MVCAQPFSPIIERPSSIGSDEPFDGIDERWQRGLRIGRDGQIHLSVALGILVIALHVQITRSDADQFGAVAGNGM